MSDITKIGMICPYREPNEVYKWKSREAKEEDDGEVKVLEVESGYELTRIPQSCCENLCAAWCKIYNRCTRTE